MRHDVRINKKIANDAQAVNAVFILYCSPETLKMLLGCHVSPVIYRVGLKIYR